MSAAASVTPPPPPPPPPAAEPPTVRCPSCGTDVAEGQQVCLECGHDLARTYRRAPSWRLWAVIGTLAALAAGAAVGIAVSQAVHKKQRKSDVTITTTAPAPPVAAAPPAAAPAPTATTPAPPAATTPAPSTTAPSANAPLATWPGRTAYTVVLATTSKRAQAETKAREAIGRGIPAGVLRSDDYRSLGHGQWLVFAGQFKTAADARAKAGGYASQGFLSAYPRLVMK
jgi:predicted nucleic acid-binding Zn ribbon protein